MLRRECRGMFQRQPPCFARSAGLGQVLNVTLGKSRKGPLDTTGGHPIRAHQHQLPVGSTFSNVRKSSQGLPQTYDDISCQPETACIECTAQRCLASALAGR